MRGFDRGDGPTTTCVPLSKTGRKALNSSHDSFLAAVEPLPPITPQTAPTSGSPRSVSEIAP
ncbi:MAG: hypothetical protein GY772_05915 [bacterium]|nr:hypothetical protein [bacterium]